MVCGLYCLHISAHHTPHCIGLIIPNNYNNNNNNICYKGDNVRNYLTNLRNSYNVCEKARSAIEQNVDKLLSRG